MKRWWLAVLLLMTFCPAVLLPGQIAATAQPAPPNPPAEQAKPASGLPLESVIVTAAKPSKGAINNFVETRAVRTHWLGRMAVWTRKICPQTIGLGDKYAKYVTQRIRDIATAVGAPVNADPACRPNIEVVFTTAPQALMGNIRKTDPLYLGFHQTASEASALAAFTHPIQAWYTTMSETAYEHRALGYGGRWLDVGKCPVGGGIAIKAGGVHELELPCVGGPSANGLHAVDGLSSGFFNVLIVADPAKLYDYEIGSLADYATLLALSQPASLDGCQELPSISSMFAKDCASTTNRISDGDLAYLQALYKLPGGVVLSVQTDYIREEMQKTLVTDKGG